MFDTGMRGGRGRFASALLRLILLGGFAAAGYGIYAWNAVKAEEYAQLDGLARFAAKSASLFFDRFDDALGHLGQDIIDHGGLQDLRATHMLMARYQRNAPELAAANLFDVDGTWVLSTRKTPGTVLPSLKEQPAWAADFRTAMESSELTVGRPIPGVIVPERIIPLKRPVRTSAGSTLFVLSAVIPLRNQQKIWNNLELLNLISSNINAGTPVLELIDEALTQLANELPHLRVSYAVIDASGRMIPVCACAGIDCEYAGGTRLDLARAPSLHPPLRSGRPVAIGNTAMDPHTAPIVDVLEAARIRSWLHRKQPQSPIHTEPSHHSARSWPEPCQMRCNVALPCRPLNRLSITSQAGSGYVTVDSPGPIPIAAELVGTQGAGGRCGCGGRGSCKESASIPFHA